MSTIAPTLSSSRRVVQKPVVLCILDGWGWREEAAENAVALGETPNFDRLWASSPHAFLDACEEHVGLPKGQIGNSEVGHMNLGAGRVVYQDLPLIDKTIASGELAHNSDLIAFIKTMRASGGTAHLMGLASPGGVHAHIRHITELARLLSREGVPVAVHAFLDGRDEAPKSAASNIMAFARELSGLANVRLATLCGRYYAMDRDKRWERVSLAYDLLTEGAGTAATDPVTAIELSYAVGVTDEFFKPVALADYKGMSDGDGLVMANFRSDRAREILTALLDPAFTRFERRRRVVFAASLGMVPYSDELDKLIKGCLFPPKDIRDGFGEVIARAGLRQLRIAETEKYPHVTFFFNGGREAIFAGEDRIMVPSPKVATYDLQPEMSSQELTDKLVGAIESAVYDVVVVNYANPDMVGHTGSLPAAIRAVEAVDRGLGRLEEAVLRQGGVMLVTADHGNCEMMRDPATGGPHTAHTLNRVPVMLVNAPKTITSLADGNLADVAPTLLRLLRLPQPAAMDGQCLFSSPREVA